MKVSKLDRPTPASPKEEKDWQPLIAWGNPFAEPDEADGAHVDNMTLRRAPDGSLVGVVDPPKKEKKS